MDDHCYGQDLGPWVVFVPQSGSEYGTVQWWHDHVDAESVPLFAEDISEDDAELRFPVLLHVVTVTRGGQYWPHRGDGPTVGGTFLVRVDDGTFVDGRSHTDVWRMVDDEGGHLDGDTAEYRLHDGDVDIWLVDGTTVHDWRALMPTTDDDDTKGK